MYYTTCFLYLKIPSPIYIFNIYVIVSSFTPSTIKSVNIPLYIKDILKTSVPLMIFI